MKAETKSILWVDDDIDKLGSYVTALINAGLAVTTSNSTAGALKCCSSDKFDVILVDIKMPHPNGIELLRQIHPICPQAYLGILSSYLYLQRYRDQIKSLGFKVELIDKDLPSIEDDNFRLRFLDPIRNLAFNGVTSASPISVVDEKQMADINPFTIDFHEFMSKSTVEKDYLTDLAEKIASNTIKTAFKEGKVWVFLCGDSKTIRATSKDYKDIYSEKKIIEFAMNLNRAPYQFLKALRSEDMWSGCSDEFSFRNYPTVTLKIKDCITKQENRELNLHFDTGSPITLFSYEELVGLNAMLPTTLFGKLSRDGSPTDMRAVPFNIQVIIKCQVTGSTKAVKLQGQAIRDWDNSPFQKFCEDGCPKKAFKDEDRRFCHERVALVGRNILTDNDLKLTLDGSIKKTSIIMKK